jgi:DNA-binding FadR family transcriptional regulator
MLLRPHKNLTSRLVEDIGIAIVTGKYSDENPFPFEADLCKQYGASRSVLREAVKMLTAKGLLGARPRHGTWVEPESDWNLLDPDVMRWHLERKFSSALLIEFTQMRLAVEPAAAAMAAIAGPEQKAAIRRALNRMVAAGHGEDDPLDSDIAFHAAILRATGNRFYEQLHELIQTALRFSIRTSNRAKGVSLASVNDHKKVLDAITAGNATLAEKLMRALIEEALALIRSGRNGKARGGKAKGKGTSRRRTKTP